MTIPEFVTMFGYYAVFLGALLEGETVLVFAGVAAHHGMLNLNYVIAIAFVASALGGHIFFYLGRRYGVAILVCFPMLRKRVPIVQRMLSQYHTLLIPVVRFLYGLRIAGLIVIGISGISSARFAFFNILGAIVWAVVITLAGYFFGALLETVLDNIKYIEAAIIAGILLIGGILWFWRRNKIKNDV